MNIVEDIDSEVLKHKHILLCYEHINPLNVIRCLGEKGIQPIAIVQSVVDVYLIPYSKYTKEIHYVNNLNEAIEKLLEYADISCPPFVYTTDDSHLRIIDQNYDLLKEKFYFFNAGEQGRITYYLDKEQQCILAGQCGLHVPKYEEVKRGELPATLSYPIITKTSNSYSKGWKRDVTICYSAEELKDAYKNMVSEYLLLQEYVVKETEYAIQGISINEGEYVYMPFNRKYVRAPKTSYGGYMYLLRTF